MIAQEEAAASERKYEISESAAEETGRSLPLLVHRRLCWMCRQESEGLAEALASEPDEFMEKISDHCSQEPDYLLPDTPMKEAVFRIILSRRNAPSTAAEISETLSEKWMATQFQRDTTPRVITRLLDSARDYYCIAPAGE